MRKNEHLCHSCHKTFFKNFPGKACPCGGRSSEPYDRDFWGSSYKSPDEIQAEAIKENEKELERIKVEYIRNSKLT